MPAVLPSEARISARRGAGARRRANSVVAAPSPLPAPEPRKGAGLPNPQRGHRTGGEREGRSLPRTKRAAALEPAPRAPCPTGAWGAAPPTEKEIRGGWVGRSGAQRPLLRDGGVGGPARYPRVRSETAPHRQDAHPALEGHAEGAGRPPYRFGPSTNRPTRSATSAYPSRRSISSAYWPRWRTLRKRSRTVSRAWRPSASARSGCASRSRRLAP